MLREAGLDLGERRAGACGDHEFGRIVPQHAAMRRDHEWLALDRPAEEVLGVAAHDPQWRAARRRIACLRSELGGAVAVHRVLQKRGRCANGSLPPWTRIAP
jgi:hypothetical protein